MDIARIKELFNSELKVINIGLDSFADNLKKEQIAVEDLDWSPPAGGDQELNELLNKVDDYQDQIKKANEKAIKIVQNGDPELVDVATAKDVLPNFSGKMILHAAPPVSWENMSGPMKGAVIGAVIYEGWAEDNEAAIKLIEAGEVSFDAGHNHNAVGPMTGVISPSMPLWVVKNKNYGNYAYCTINDGSGKSLTFGANNAEVIEKLHWIRDKLGPALKKAVNKSDGINLKNMTSEALHMGDEVHNRNKAGSILFLKKIIPHLFEVKIPESEMKDIISYISENDFFYLNLSMPASKSILDAANGIENSSLVTAMARNGFEFGIRISGLGDNWYTGPAQVIDGLYFPGYSKEDACRDIGDSAISETAAVGGFAMAAAPAIVGFVGGTIADAIKYTKTMYQITMAENSDFTIPFLDFRGTPTGIDLLKVIESGQLPIINTGIAHKKPGIGEIGAGLVNPPLECFAAAFKDFSKKLLND